MTSANEPISARGARGASHIPWVARSTGEPVFELTLTPTLEDHMAVDYGEAKPFGSAPSVGLTSLLALGVAAFFAEPAWRARDYASVALFLGAGLLAAWVIRLALRWAIVRFMHFVLTSERTIGVPYVFRAGRGGVELTGNGIDTMIQWSSFVDIERDETRYLFWLSVTKAVVVPFAALANENERRSFEEWIATWYGRAPRHPPRMVRERTPPSDPAGTTPRGETATPSAREAE